MRVFTMLRSLFKKPAPKEMPTVEPVPEERPPSFLAARKELREVCMENVKHSQEVRELVKRKKTGNTIEIRPPVPNGDPC